MVDLWTNQNAEKQYEKSLAAERKASDLRNIELEKEKLEIERELENRKRIEKQNILKAELQQQIQELSKSSLICTAKEGCVLPIAFFPKLSPGQIIIK